MGGWPYPLDAVQGFFEGISSIVHTAFNFLHDTVWGMVTWLFGRLDDLIRPIANVIVTLTGTVWGQMLQLFSYLKAELDSLWLRIIGKVNGIIDYLSNQLTSATSFLSNAVASIPAAITGTLGTVITTVASTVITGLSQFVQWILQGLTLFWNFLTGTVVPAISSAMAAAFQFLKDLFTNTFRTIMQILGIGAPLEPENALIHAIEVAIPAFLVNFGIFLAATGSDLLHPLKGTGVVPSAIEIVRSLGPEIVSGAIVGSYAFAVVESPLKLYWNSIARPHRPRGAITDRMFFHGAIDMPTVRKMMSYEGLPDWAIDAWVRSWWQEPSDRLIIALVDDPSIPPNWIRQKLQDRGYSAVDIDVLVNYAQNKALGKVKGSREGTVITRYSQGFIAEDEFTQELLALGYRPELISKAKAAAVLGRDTDERKELVKVWTEQFRKDLLTVDEFRSNLETVIASTRLLEAIIELERTRRFPTPKRPAAV